MAFKTLAVLLALAAPASGILVHNNATVVHKNDTAPRTDPAFANVRAACANCFETHTKACLCMAYKTGEGREARPFCVTPYREAYWIQGNSNGLARVCRARKTGRRLLTQGHIVRDTVRCATYRGLRGFLKVSARNIT